MIDLHYRPTPNGQKIAICLEETSIPYKIVRVNLGNNDQFGTGFFKISPTIKFSPSSITIHKMAVGE